LTGDKYVEPTFLILAHDSSSNALGRAQSMALVAQQLGSTEIWALDGGKLWQGASQFETRIRVIARHTRSIRTALREAVNTNGPLVIWVCKGYAPLPQVVRLIKKASPNAVVVLDLDDDDAGLAEDFRRSSLMNALKLNFLRRGHPWRIRRSQGELAKIADGLTFATETLRTRFAGFDATYERVPHVRVITPVRTSEQTRLPIRVGAFGTIRPHKGSALLLSLISTFPDVRLSTFAASGMGAPTDAQTNWVEIDPSTPLELAYANVDVAVIPITNLTRASTVQLPAKLVDAMRAGVPIVASKTEAIDEIAAGCYSAIAEGATADDVRSAITVALANGGGEAARARYESLLTPEKAAIRLRSLLGRIVPKVSNQSTGVESITPSSQKTVPSRRKTT
jgi:glycosyltransferase involved in cell wall biosynthesis